MTDRLADLLRQRAQLQGQLARLDRQIADAHTETAATATPSISPSALRAPKILPDSMVVTDPDAIISQYSSEPIRLKQDIRKGCLLYCAVALAILALGIAALLRFYRH